MNEKRLTVAIQKSGKSSQGHLLIVETLLRNGVLVVVVVVVVWLEYVPSVKNAREMDNNVVLFPLHSSQIVLFPLHSSIEMIDPKIQYNELAL